jgi:RNA polymerase sigma-70 factor (ECF subfamily)
VEYGRAVAAPSPILIRQFGDIGCREEAVQECVHRRRGALAGGGTAAEGPAGWIITTARNRAIDRLASRSSARRTGTHRPRLLHGRPEPAEEGPVARRSTAPDLHRVAIPRCDRLAQVALTLRLLGGLSTAEIARAFSCPSRRWRSGWSGRKGKIRDAGIPYVFQAESDLPERFARCGGGLPGLQRRIRGHPRRSGGLSTRQLCAPRPIRLGQVLDERCRRTGSDGPARADALIDRGVRPRTTARAIVGADQQDRERWDRNLIAEGHAIVRRGLARNRPARNQIQAAINAVHADARTANETDWKQILQLTIN